MCGICGEIRFDDSQAGVVAVDAMNRALAPRGPDAGGLFLQDRIALGHRRLSILDLSLTSQQPMVDPELGLAIVFNGCIYNFRELRRELQGKGYRFFSTGDTEVILKAYHAWGPRCVERFHGMFAFALAERNSGRVVLARDRLGIKPMYLAHNGKALRFASTLPALLAAGGIDTEIDPAALHHYMSFHAVVPAPMTILEGVRKLPPATIRMIEPNGQWREEVYWSLPPPRAEANDGMREADWCDAVLASLQTAVERRRVADVPVGVLLSGGLDSSLLVALFGNGAGSNKLKTFSIGFERVGDLAGDEFRYSDLIAQTFGTDHHRIHIDSARALSALPSAVAAMSEPMIEPRCHRLLSPVGRGLQAHQGRAKRSGCGRGLRRVSLVSAHDARERSGRRVCARLFRPRPRRDEHGACAALHERRLQSRLRRELLCRAPRRVADRQGASARHQDHAGRRSGQARRQHDHGVGSGSARSVPRP